MDEKLTTSTPQPTPNHLHPLCSTGTVPPCQLQDAQYKGRNVALLLREHLLEPGELLLDAASYWPSAMKMQNMHVLPT